MMPTAIQHDLPLDNNQSGMMPNPGQHDSLKDNIQSNMMPIAIQHDLIGNFTGGTHMSKLNPNNQQHYLANTDPAWFNPVAPTGHGSAGSVTSQQTNSSHSSPDMPSPDSVACQSAQTSPEFHSAHTSNNGNVYGPGFVRREADRIERRLENHGAPPYMTPLTYNMASERRFHPMINNNSVPDFNPARDYAKEAPVEPGPSHESRQNNNANGTLHHQNVYQSNRKRQFGQYYDDHEQWKMPRSSQMQEARFEGAPGAPWNGNVGDYNNQFRQYDAGVPWQCNYNNQGYPVQEHVNFNNQELPGTRSHFLKTSSHDDQTGRKYEFGEYQLPREGDAHGPTSSQMHEVSLDRTGPNLESQWEIRSLNGTGARGRMSYNNQGYPVQDQTGRKYEFGEYQMPGDGNAHGPTSSQMNGASLDRTGPNMESQWEIRSLNGTGAQGLMSYNNQGYPVQDQTGRKYEFGEYQMPGDGNAHGPTSSQMNGASLDRTGPNMESQWEIRSLNGTGAQGLMSYNNQGYPGQEHGAFNNQGFPGTSSQLPKTSSHEDQASRKNEFGEYQLPREGDTYGPDSSQMPGANLEGIVKNLGAAGAQWQENHNNNQVQEHDTSKNPNITPLSTHLSDAFIALDAHLESTNRTGPEEQALTGNNSQILQKNAPQDYTHNNPVRFEMNGNNFNPDQANTSCQDLERGDNAIPPTNNLAVSTQLTQSVPDNDVHLGLEDLDWKYPDGECNFETCSNNIVMIEPLKEIEAERGPEEENPVPELLQQIINEVESSSQEVVVQRATRTLASLDSMNLTEEEKIEKAKKREKNREYRTTCTQKKKEMRKSYVRGAELLPIKILGPQQFRRNIEEKMEFVGEACPGLLCHETNAYKSAMKELDKKFEDQKGSDLKLVEVDKKLAVEKEKFEEADREYKASRKSCADAAAAHSETVHIVLDSQTEVAVENEKIEEATEEYDNTKSGTAASQKTRAKQAAAHWENVYKVLDSQWTLLYETKLAGLAVLYLQRTMSILIPKLKDVKEQCHQQGKDKEFEDFMVFLRKHRRLFMVPKNKLPSGSTEPIKLPNG
ncbi:unnamed protein product [Caenorhabditis brenneri]